ncbi:hypothetical protein HYW82_01395 [Candidatus Peregrinibacteria bacterium]|nr:hypothetical protein [Candidatus Peregrinibacteria bacterium]
MDKTPKYSPPEDIKPAEAHPEARRISAKLRDDRNQEQLKLLQAFRLEWLYDERNSASFINYYGSNFYPEYIPDSKLKNTDGIPTGVMSILDCKPAYNLHQTQIRQAVTDELLKFDPDKLIQVLCDIFNCTNELSRIFVYDKEAGGAYIYLAIKGEHAALKSVEAYFQDCHTAVSGIMKQLSGFNTAAYPFLAKVYATLTESLERLGQTVDFTRIKNGETGLAQEIEKQMNVVNNNHRNLSTAACLAKLAIQEGYGRAEFDPKQPRTFEGGWHIGSDREKEVCNPSVDDSPITVFEGPNMSGKSHSGLEREFGAQWSAQLFGYGPFRRGNFPVHYRYFVLISGADNGSRRFNVNTHIGEIRSWMGIINEASMFPGRMFICADEPFPSTSPQDQDALIHGIGLRLTQLGERLLITTHNERSISRYRDNANTRSYHFETSIDADGKLQCRYTLSEITGENKADSHAVTVMRLLGVNDDLIRRTNEYVAGTAPEAGKFRQKQWPQLGRYTDSEREEMKQSAVVPTRFATTGRIASFGTSGEVLQHKASLISETYDYKTQAGPVSRDVYSDPVLHYAENMYLDPHPCSPKETLERQKTLEALLQDTELLEKLSSLNDIIRRFLSDIKWLPAGALEFSRLASVNKALKPSISKPKHNMAKIDKDNYKMMIMFLEFNKKILGEKFSLDAELNKFKECFDVYSNDPQNPDVKKQIEEMFARMEKLCDDLPDISLFECDIDAIGNELKSILDFAIGRLDLEDFADDIFFCLALRALLGGEPPEIQEFLNNLRAVDSVHCHQIANGLKTLWDQAAISLSTRDADWQETVPICDTRKIYEKLVKYHRSKQQQLKGVEQNAIDDLLISQQEDTQLMEKHADALSRIDQDSDEAIAQLSVARDYFAETHDLNVSESDFESLKEHIGIVGAYLDLDEGIIEKFFDEIDVIQEKWVGISVKNEIKGDAYGTTKINKIAQQFKSGNETGFDTMDQFLAAQARVLSDIDSKQETLQGVKEKLKETSTHKLHITLNFNPNALMREFFASLALPRIAQIIREGAFAKVEFNESGRIEIIQGKNMRNKNYRAQNTQFNDGQKLRTLRSRNGSGKSAYLEAQLTGMAFAMATGYYPAASATMPHFDRIAFLRTPKTKGNNDMSSFGEEALRINELYNMLQGDECVLYLIDELGTTTSPLYQGALIHALSCCALEHGQIGVIATHHHEPCRKLETQYPVFVTPGRFAENFELIEGEAGDSEGVEIAEKEGLDSTVIKFAKLAKESAK